MPPPYQEYQVDDYPHVIYRTYNFWPLGTMVYERYWLDPDVRVFRLCDTNRRKASILVKFDKSLYNGP